MCLFCKNKGLKLGLGMSLLMTTLFLIPLFPAHALDVDLSRRQVEFTSVKDEDRLAIRKKEESTFQFVEKIFESVEPSQDIVIMSTEKGFIPSTINLRKGGNYRLHIVNLNQSHKNASFILDAFGQHHATMYGEQTQVTVSPKTEGVFSFQCPESAFQGKLVVTQPESLNPKTARTPASE